MTPSDQFCPNSECRAKGQCGTGSIVIHSRKEKRYRCKVCNRTFTETKGTTFYRLKVDQPLVTLILVLLCHGCPIQAVVAAYGFDERTVALWLERGGEHCKKVHEYVILDGKIEDVHVQADELYVKMVMKKMWMAMAMAVSSRLWLGGVISMHRDRALITSLVCMVRDALSSWRILVCVDGLAAYVTAFVRVFRHVVRNGQRGRPRLVEEPGMMIGQVIKQYSGRTLVDVVRRIVRGTSEAITAALQVSRGGSKINTSYIERLNATFRASLATLVRRGRSLARTDQMILAGMYLVGCAYNFCWHHDSLRVLSQKEAGRKWIERTPAMAAGLVDQSWTMQELLSYRVPPR